MHGAAWYKRNLSLKRNSCDIFDQVDHIKAASCILRTSNQQHSVVTTLHALGRQVSYVAMQSGEWPAAPCNLPALSRYALARMRRCHVVAP